MAEDNYPTITPILTASDVDKSIGFYESLGFKTEFRMPGPDGKTVHSALSFRDSKLMIGGVCPGGPQPGGGAALYIDVPDVKAARAVVGEAGVKVTEDVRDQFWGRRDFTITDPDGYHVTFSQFVRVVEPQDMEKAMKEAMSAMVTAH